MKANSDGTFGLLRTAVARPACCVTVFGIEEPVTWVWVVCMSADLLGVRKQFRLMPVDQRIVEVELTSTQNSYCAQCS